MLLSLHIKVSVQYLTMKFREKQYPSRTSPLNGPIPSMMKWVIQKEILKLKMIGNKHPLVKVTQDETKT